MKKLLFQKSELEIYLPKNTFLFILLGTIALLLSPLFLLFVFEIFSEWNFDFVKFAIIFFYTIVLLGLYSLYYYKKKMPYKIRINKQNVVFEYSNNPPLTMESKNFPYFGFIYLQRKRGRNPSLFLYNDKTNMLICLVDIVPEEINKIIDFLKGSNFQYWNEQNKQDFWMDEYHFLRVTKNNFLYLNKEELQESNDKILIKKEKYIIGTFLILLLFVSLFFMLVYEMIYQPRLELLLPLLLIIIFTWILSRGVYNQFFNIKFLRNNSELLIYKKCNIFFLSFHYICKKISLHEDLSTFLKIYHDGKVSKIEILNQKALNKLQNINFVRLSLFEYVLERIRFSNEVFEIDLFNKDLREIFAIYNRINQLLSNQ